MVTVTESSEGQTMKNSVVEEGKELKKSFLVLLEQSPISKYQKMFDCQVVVGCFALWSFLIS